MNNQYPVIISFYTNTWEYPKYAELMKKSCERLKLEYHIKEMPDTKNWLNNTRIKPKFILDSLKELKKPVLWIDVDGTLRKRPDLLKGCKYDFAARPKPKGQSRIWHVGTMFFNYTDKCLNFFDAWLNEIEQTRGSDELCLDRVWKRDASKFGLKTMKLPSEYFEMLKNINQVPSSNTVICHRASLCENKLEMKKRKII